MLEAVRSYLLYGEALLGGSSVARSVKFGPVPREALGVADIVEIGKNELSKNQLGKSSFWKTSKQTLFAENPALLLDFSQALEQLNWQSAFTTEEALVTTFGW